MKILQKLEAEDKIRLYYFDESGFSTLPLVPYAWCKKGEVIELPSKRSKRLNVLGFMRKNNDAFFHAVEGMVATRQVVEAFDAFAADYAENYMDEGIPAIVVMDNASVHTSAEFLAQKDTWMAHGIGLHYLPTYSPELNLIEILWRKIKYDWLPLNCYESYEKLKEAVLSILVGFGEKYLITFS